ncbi:response regulator transcription factor [Variovorax sp. J22R133]|uniref:response regulator n=1 Tax=Variovorax brevis TaxID=3053503 RepID=UPI002578A493|nr:response regulator transcription factor [Variovorax sp. J22R133]MDM0112321.1 response regulator transcription factor [Variovorax sp. J22R133]
MSERIHDPVRVILADDHAIFRHGVRRVLEHWGTIDVVAECGDGQSALDAWLELRPDLLLLDLRMPRLDGLEVVRRVLEADPAARILIMTTYSTEQDIGHALRAGARGYLLKDAAPEEVLRAILRVVEGGMVLAPDIAAQYVQTTTRAELSPRESQILRMLGAGKPNKEIARNLSLELSTVKGHVRSVLDKLGVRNRTEAVAEATRRGFVPQH